MPDLDFRIVDADHHYYEPDDAFTLHLESAYADRAVHIRRDEGTDYGQVWIGDERLQYFTASPSEVTGRPGALQQYFKGKESKGNALLVSGAISAADLPESQDRELRLAQLDEQDIEAILLFPSLAIGVEHEMRHDAGALYAEPPLVQPLAPGGLGLRRGRSPDRCAVALARGHRPRRRRARPPCSTRASESST